MSDFHGISPALDMGLATPVARRTEDPPDNTMHQTGIGMLQVSLDGRRLRANSYLQAMTGYTSEELALLPKLALTHPDDRDIVLQDFRRLASGEADTYSGERRYVAKDGRTLSVWVSATLVPGDSPETSYLVVIVEDNASRKRTEEALRKSEERFRLAMKGANEGLWDWEIANGASYLSPRWKSMLGYEENEIENTPESWEPLLAPGMLEKLRERIVALEGGQTDVYEIELKMRHKDGRWIDILSRAFPVLDENRKMVRLVGTHQDITDRKRYETELRRASIVFASTHEGIVVTDAARRIEMINPAFTRITGYAESEMIGRPISDLQSNRHSPEFHTRIWTQIHESGHWQGEIWKRRKDGAVYPEWLTISEVRDASGGVVNYVGVFADISQLKQSQARLDFLAHHDPLTSLPNRLLLREQIDRAIETGRREGRSRAILFLDLDRFKTINDSLGHAFGDRLLALVSDRWRQRLGPNDMLARLGGDEFVVLLEPAESRDVATEVAADLIGCMSEPFAFEDGSELYVGLSIGITMFPAGDAHADELIQQADSALYAAKEIGGGGIRFYSPEQTETARMRLEMEAGLRRALDRGELVLQYQPQISLFDRSIRGVEALLRWRTPTGLIPPDDFIPLAEKTGLMIPIGEWVLRESCARMRSWLDAGHDVGTIAVNLSPRQFDRSDVTERIRSVLTETRLPPERLEIEITEGALMEQGRNATRKLEALKALGLRIAIDDFGIGHSSLARLKRFPIDRLKLDRSFIVDIPVDPTSMEIAAAVVRLSHSLNVEAVAEGVETEAQADFLTRSGCAVAQGYLFARPLWEADLLRFLAETPQEVIAD